MKTIRLFGPSTGSRGRVARFTSAGPQPDRIGTSNKTLVLAVIFGTMTFGSATALNEGMLRAGVAAVQRTVDYIAQRSPGIRTRALMTKGKAYFDKTRTARALPRVRTPPSFASGPMIPGPVAFEPIGAPGVAGPLADGAPVLFASAPIGSGFNFPGGNVFVFPPIGGSGGSGGGGGGGVVVVPPPAPPPGPGVLPPPAVPEPATWMTMLLGFGTLGFVARRRKRYDARQV